MIFIMTVFEEPLIGTYLAGVALAAYALVTIWPGVVRCRAYFARIRR